jgi:hypothetical protein
VAELINSDNKIHNLYPSPSIHKAINPRIEHVTGTGDPKNAFKDFVEEPERTSEFFYQLMHYILDI